MKYFNERQPLHHIPDMELEMAFKTLVEAFSKEWLTKAPFHPLRALWERKDTQASQELFALGSALAKLIEKDPKWVRDQIKQMRSAERNNYQGAFTELLTINMLHGEHHQTMPARTNQAGFDALLQVGRTGKQIRYSIKNYGQSQHEEKFEQWSKRIEVLVEKLIRKHRYYPVTVIIDSPVKYPTNDMWKLLESNLDEIFKLKKGQLDYFAALADEVPLWTIVLLPEVTTQGELHPDYYSYTLIVSAIYHHNESQNLLSKLSDACSNLVKHSAIEDEKTRNILWVHLSPLASVKKCKEWLDEYFTEYPHKPISVVHFHQPSVISPSNEGSSQIVNYFHNYTRPERMAGWLPSGFRFFFHTPVGQIIQEPAIQMIIYNDEHGKEQRLSIDDRYMFQRGKHYTKMQHTADGTWTGNMAMVASGVYTQSVIQLPGQTEQLLMAGRFPPSDRLLVL
jgi:hypothetical protein